MGVDRGEGEARIEREEAEEALGRKRTRDGCKTPLRSRKSKKRCGWRQHFSTVSTGVEGSGGPRREGPERVIPQNGDLSSPDPVMYQVWYTRAWCGNSGKEGREIDWLPGGHCTQCAAERRSDRPAVYTSRRDRHRSKVVTGGRWSMRFPARCISEGLESLQRDGKPSRPSRRRRGDWARGCLQGTSTGQGKKGDVQRSTFLSDLLGGGMSLTGAWYGTISPYSNFLQRGICQHDPSSGSTVGRRAELLEPPMEPMTVRDGPIAYGSNTIGRSVVHGLAERVRIGLLNACPFRQIAPGSILSVGYRGQNLLSRPP